MIRQLVEANYFANRAAPSPEQLTSWFQELSTPARRAPKGKRPSSNLEHAELV